MKRYKPELKRTIANRQGEYEIKPSMTEDPNGEWYRRGDVRALTVAGFVAIQIVPPFQCQASAGVEGVALECESVECNCVDELARALAFADDQPLRLHWICPAHGYKRL